jgi:hypothetical protein
MKDEPPASGKGAMTAGQRLRLYYATRLRASMTRNQLVTWFQLARFWECFVQAVELFLNRPRGALGSVELLADGCLSRLPDAQHGLLE